MEELYSTEGDYGLRTLSEPDEAVVDIVFVHGLTGNRETTWTHKESKTFWPQTLLAHDLPNARILTFGYDADIVGALNTAGSDTLRDHGKSLANDVALRRMRSRTALLVARGAAQQHLKDVLESTAAIAFMGTPHIGSAKADWATPLTRLSNILRKTNSEIVRMLKPGSEMLANLQ
ncbi:hypothetical protein H2201_008656 [Coniosporium apollinis]|uniref:DUF676 domain-containing protein n=1 Tax=Coniosporium apollinis TaxID=61459 RepID=A0ABQ9NG71_9PEZI|nr:hypothetical protein H2201_008656 [Coniosporium apollinis]